MSHEHLKCCETDSEQIIEVVFEMFFPLKPYGVTICLVETIRKNGHTIGFDEDYTRFLKIVDHAS